MLMIKRMMFTKNKSRLNFEETVKAVRESAVEHGWKIPSIYDLQKEYMEAGYKDMTRAKIIYFCSPHNGYRILKNDSNKQMSVMMPMGVSVYETDDGQVYIAAMNLGFMSKMFGGVVKEAMGDGAQKLKKTIANIIEH